MTTTDLQHRETLLIELLLSSLDTRETSRAAGSTMLSYLADLLVQQAHKELDEMRAMLSASDGRVNTIIA